MVKCFFTDDNLKSTEMTTNTDFLVDWQQKISNNLLDKFINDGVIFIDDCFSLPALQQLQAESGFLDYRDAHLTAGERVSHIRGDRIRWIDEQCLAGMAYLQAIGHLAQFFNQTLFAGIRRWEAHYACYPIGFGYQWHSDNPKGRDERVISAVFYLNDDWQSHDGGAIAVVNNLQQTLTFLPKANRLIIFDSNLLHEVQIAHRQRYSIATWFRKDNGIF